MKFKTVAEAFNHYINYSNEQIEARAAELRSAIDTDANIDIAAVNIEIEGLNQVKANNLDRNGHAEARSGLNMITGTNFETRASVEATDGDVFASMEYRNAFYKKLLNQPLTSLEATAYKRAQEVQSAERRADAFNTVTDSPAIVPTHTLNEVIKKARTMGGIMEHARQFAMPGNIAIPVGTPGSKASWHTEGATVESEKVDTTSVIFKNYEIIKIFSMSAATKASSIEAFEAYLVEELTASVMEAIADSLVNGTGVAQGLGVLSGVTWADDVNQVTVATGKELAFKEVTKVVGLLKRGYSKGAKFAMNNRTLYSSFYGMVDNNGRPIFIQDPKGESIGKVLTYDVIVDDNLADDEVLFGNFSYVGYNLPSGIVIETSRQSSFKNGLIDYRALAIADTKPIVSEAFVRITKGE